MSTRAVTLAILAACLLVTGCAPGPQNNARTQGKQARTQPPPFAEELSGANPLRVRNPNEFSVLAAVRSGRNGKDFQVPPNGVWTVYIPDGRYDIYFVYSDKPDALFQGDAFTLANNGAEIQIVKVVNGNYGIRQVK